MKKRVFGRHLSRDIGARRALFRSQVRALVLFGAIRTTKAKAKAVQGMAEKLVTIAKEGTVINRRRIYALLGNDRKTTDTLFKLIGPTFLSRSGGYTRIVKLQPRRGDRAELARLEWSEKVQTQDKVQEKAKKGKDAKPQTEKQEKTKK